MEAKVHKTQFSFHRLGIFSFVLQQIFLRRLKELLDLSTALRCVLSSRPAPLEIFLDNAASQRVKWRLLWISKPHFHTSTSQLCFWFGSTLLSSGPHPRSHWPDAVPSMSELIPLTQYQPKASHSISEQNQPFALALALCAINNSQWMWSVPGKTVEWTISSKQNVSVGSVIMLMYSRWADFMSNESNPPVEPKVFKQWCKV